MALTYQYDLTVESTVVGATFTVTRAPT